MAKTAFITGAYRGLGYETARQLLAKGFEVFLSSRRTAEGQKAAKTLSASGKVTFIQMDVTSDESIAAAVKEVSKKIAHLDVLVNNAAVFPDPTKGALETTRAMLYEAFNINAASVLIVSQAFTPLLTAAKGARILNLASGLGALNEMNNSCTAYSISKTALNAVTRQLAGALADKKILVNSVCPGWVRTKMGGPNAPRSVEEGAEGIIWMATSAPADKTGLFWQDHKVLPW
jgi:NAD(P)-dependent dehydrogenase (short-subunit alcohol dehydrogenase family)